MVQRHAIDCTWMCRMSEVAADQGDASEVLWQQQQQQQHHQHQQAELLFGPQRPYTMKALRGSSRARPLTAGSSRESR